MEKVKKTLSFVEALAIVVGMIIGSGIFLKPSIVLADAGTPLASLLAWIAGGIITLASALSIAEIASAIPRSGGLYVYLEELYGEPVGYLLGWVQTIVSYPASIAAQTIAFATLFRTVLANYPFGNICVYRTGIRASGSNRMCYAVGRIRRAVR